MGGKIKLFIQMTGFDFEILASCGVSYKKGFVSSFVNLFKYTEKLVISWI